MFEVDYYGQEGSIVSDIIYADNAATTVLDECAFEAMLPFLKENYSNPSAVYSFAQQSAYTVEKARKTVADCINCRPEEIYFTSGGTESDNIAVKCASSKRKKTITVKTEHKAVINSCLTLEKEGFSVAFADVNSDGTVDETSFSKLMTDNAGIVSVMLANNETGTLQSISDLSSLAHRHGAVFHTDAVQACGHINVDVQSLGVDLLSASAHKFNGPKGVGFLYVKKGIPVGTLIDGGSQENGLRGGTLNVPGIVGMAAALKNNCENLGRNTEHIKSVEMNFLSELDRAGINYTRNGGGLPGILSLSFCGYDAEALVHRLDLMGICVSAGAACDSRETRISHVLEAMNVSRENAAGTLRFSFGKYNTLSEASEIVSALSRILTDK